MRPPYLTAAVPPQPVTRGLLLALTLGVVLAVCTPRAAAATGGAGLAGAAPGPATGAGALAPTAHPRRTVRRHRIPRRHRATPPTSTTPTSAPPTSIPPTSTTPTPPVSPTAPGRLVIHGGGDGHGIGMSQYGAEGYARHGVGYRAILAHYYSGTALGQTSPDQIVRVLIASGRASFRGASRAGGVGLSASVTYSVTTTGTGLRLVDAATGRTVAMLPTTVTVSGPGPLRTAGGVYRGSLQFSAVVGGAVQTVDAVGLDDYVRGVVAAEMPSSWSPAALEAQAVAARTYAITATVDGAGYDLYDDTRSQVYGGVSAEAATADAAVAATAGQIVTYAGRPAITYFFASSGGFTESIQNAWPGSAPEPWLRGVPDPYDAAAGDPYHSWQLSMSLAAATAKLGSLVDGTLERIVVTRRGVSPRIVRAVVVGTRGSTTATGAQLQQAFGLISTDAEFTVGR